MYILKAKGRPKPALIATDLPPPRQHSFNVLTPKGMVPRQQECRCRPPRLPQASPPEFHHQYNPTSTPMATPTYGSSDNIPQAHLIEPDEIFNPSQQAKCVVLDNTPNIPHATHFYNSVMEPAAGNIMEYRYLIHGPDKKTWKKSLANDLGRLAQGVGTCMKNGTNTIFFVKQLAVPTDQTVSYCQFVDSLRPNKVETHRVLVTTEGSLLDFPGITST